MSAPLAVSCPAFPLLGEPGGWTDLELAAATVFLETEGEPEEGAVAVAWVIGTRALEAGGVRAAILGRDGAAYEDERPFEPFSAWNDDYRVRARTRLAAATETAWAWRAAAAGLWRVGNDPSHGAYFYLNETLTRKIRGGSLPSWFHEDRVSARIGRHAFLRA